LYVPSHSGRKAVRAVAVFFLISVMVLFGLQPIRVRADLSPYGGSTTIVPSTNAILFGSSGNVKIDIPVRGIAVRIEVPREFLQGVVSGENDTHWITSNIRNDYYYYNVVDESLHWTYDWHDNASDGPCFKPDFSYYDPNAPYCVEIWNYLNTYPQNFLKPQQYNVSVGPAETFDYTYRVGIDYCQTQNVGKFVFGCFTAPKFVMLHNLQPPSYAGLYNFTLSVANRTNILGYPDFVHAWNTTLFVPVSMAYNAGSISGQICDGGNSPCTPIHGKGIVYAVNEATGSVVARAYVNQSQCMSSGTGCGLFKLTGLDPGPGPGPPIQYIVEGSAGVDNGYAYSLTQYPCCQIVSPNKDNPLTGPLALNRAPLFSGQIVYHATLGDTGVRSLSDDSGLLEAGFRGTPLEPNPDYNLNITVLATDSSGHVYRFRGVSSDSSGGDAFCIVTGVGVNYVGDAGDPYGTEFAGLPGGVGALTVSVWVSGYNQVSFPTLTVNGSPGSGPGTPPPSCSNSASQGGVAGSGGEWDMLQGGVVSGLLYFCPTATSTCTDSPHTDGEEVIPGLGAKTDALFGGNVVIEACTVSCLYNTVQYDTVPVPYLGGVSVINGTLPDGETGYESCDFKDTCPSLPFYIAGFSEYYDHTLSGFWSSGHLKLNDSGLNPIPYGSSPLPSQSETYYLQFYIRGYEPTSVSITVSPTTVLPVSVNLTPVEPLRVTVGSYDNRPNLIINGTYAIQAKMPWRFLNSSIPVTARVYFCPPTPCGYVEALMEIAPSFTNEIGVISLTTYSFTVIFAGQNWSLRDIWFYGLLPSTLQIGTAYTVQAYTLGYYPQFPGGIAAGQIGPLTLSGPIQAFVPLFIADEIDITVPIFHDPQNVEGTPEEDYPIGQVFSGATLMGAEMADLNANVQTLQFNLFGFGAMELSNHTLCTTNVNLVGQLNICGQGHFYYISPTGGCIEPLALLTQPSPPCTPDYGLNAGTYTPNLSYIQGENNPQPEFGFTVHFYQVLQLPVVTFNDLFLQQGVFLEAIQMAEVTQGATAAVAGYCNSPRGAGFCYYYPSSEDAPLSWAQVQASNSTFSRSVSTFDGLYDGVGALFLPAGTYLLTFCDVQYQSPTPVSETLGWGNSLALTPPILVPCSSGTSCTC